MRSERGPKAPLLSRRMFKRELTVARLVDLDHERHSALGAAKGEGLAGVLVGDGIQVLEVVIGTALDHSATRSGQQGSCASERIAER